MGLTIPDDVSVVGFDDIRYAEAMNPPLTTVAQPAEEIGERCFRRLMKALAEPGSESGVEIVPHRLVIRDSAEPPAAIGSDISVDTTYPYATVC